MRSKITQLQFELDAEKKRSESLVREKLELEADCRLYKKSILAMIHPSEPYAEEQISDLMINGDSFDKVLADLEAPERS